MFGLVLAAAVAPLFDFGGVSFGVGPEALKNKFGGEVLEQPIVGDSSAKIYYRAEIIAGVLGKREWFFKDGRFVEGVLTISQNSQSLDDCRKPNGIALGALRGKYAVEGQLIQRKVATSTTSDVEVWKFVLSDGSSIEQHLLFTPLISSCNIATLYRPAPKGMSAF